MDLVWRDYDQETLDFECNPARSVADDRPYLRDYVEHSRAARAAFGTHRTLQYGPSAVEEIDVFPSAVASSPVLVFIHGGGWRSLSKDDVSFVASALVPSGITVVSVGHALIPAVPLSEIVRQVRVAFAWISKRAADFNGDRNRLYVGGHSAGAHLAAMLSAPGWQNAHGIAPDAVRGAVLVSGNYDLEPLRLSYRNAWLGLDTATARELSPLTHVPDRGGTALVVWGGAESRQYKIQAHDFAARWRSRGGAAEEIELAGRNHFETVLELAAPEGALARRVRRLMFSAVA